MNTTQIADQLKESAYGLGVIDMEEQLVKILDGYVVSQSFTRDELWEMIEASKDLVIKNNRINNK